MKWNKNTQDKLNETVLQICNTIDKRIKEGILYNSNDVEKLVYDYIESLADWLHKKTCKEMIDID